MVFMRRHAMRGPGTRNLEKPVPGAWVDGLADGAQDAQRGAIVRGHVRVVLRLQRADQRWRRVELAHLRDRSGAKSGSLPGGSGARLHCLSCLALACYRLQRWPSAHHS